MSIYSVNFNQLWETLLPPVIRKPIQLAWGACLMEPIQYLRDLVLEDYMIGSDYPSYSSASAYTTSDRVIYIDRGVYESLSGSTSGITPFNTTYWRKVNDNYIGVNERVKYNAQKIVFEYGLNRWFQCTGIYIENTVLTDGIFLLGETGEYSSAMADDSIFQNQYMPSSYVGFNQYGFIIYVPIAVFNALASTDLERENIIRSFADEYNIAGMLYQVISY